MSRIVPLLIVLSLGFAPAPVYRQKPNTKTDLEKMQGVWERVSCSTNRDEETAVYCGNRLSCFHKGGTSTQCDVVLDSSKEPRWIDRKDADVPDQKLLGIYKLDGDTLTCAWRMQYNAPDRPKEFRPHPLMCLEVYRRKKP